ncbi:MAG: 2-succinyl-5-enolpyruvyl-6-hydroxy-3-cyclohexene-1-carboxylic-acid synthase, partial [Nostocoides sp.]
MNPSTVAATAIVDALVEGGVREVVLCPGSRSAPVAYAVRSAERAGRLRLHVRVDERSAGFLALGLGKRSGWPAVVVTTSGTAVANLHPAVLEAYHARVPLVVLSADRPAELRGTGANQTTIQPGIFGGVVLAEADLAPLASADGALRAEVSRLLEVAAGQIDPSGDRYPGVAAGPVHLNVQFREPLVPDADDEAVPFPASTPEAADRETAVSRWLQYSEAPTPRPTRMSTSRGLPQRSLVVMADLPRAGQAEAALDWAAGLGVPVVAEPFGPHPRTGVVEHGVLVLGDRDFVDAHPPECVVVIGRPTLSRQVSALVRRPDVRLVVVDSGPDWSVPGRVVERVPWSVIVVPSVPGGLGTPLATPNPPVRP